MKRFPLLLDGGGAGVEVWPQCRCGRRRWPRRLPVPTALPALPPPSLPFPHRGEGFRATIPQSNIAATASGGGPASSRQRLVRPTAPSTEAGRAVPTPQTVSTSQSLSTSRARKIASSTAIDSHSDSHQVEQQRRGDLQPRTGGQPPASGQRRDRSAPFDRNDGRGQAPADQQHRARKGDRGQDQQAGRQRRRRAGPARAAAPMASSTPSGSAISRATPARRATNTGANRRARKPEGVQPGAGSRGPGTCRQAKSRRVEPGLAGQRDHPAAGDQRRVGDRSQPRRLQQVFHVGEAEVGQGDEHRREDEQDRTVALQLAGRTGDHRTEA